MIVRRLEHGLGYRFRLYRPDLPGKPDLTFPRRKAVLFVHGCFWHGHDCKRGARTPKTNVAYWSAKIAERDTRRRPLERAATGGMARSRRLGMPDERRRAPCRKD